MIKTEIDRIEEIRQEIKNNNHSLLIVGDSKSNLFKGKKLEKLPTLKTINLNYSLSRILTSIPKDERIDPIGIIENILSNIESDAVIFLNNNHVLFDSSLNWNPFEIFKKLSRSYRILALWDGNLEGDIIKYARPGHLEFHEFKSSDSGDLFIIAN